MPSSWACLEDTEMLEADCFNIFFPATPMIPNRSFQGGNMTCLLEMIRRRKVPTTFYNAFCFGHLNLTAASGWSHWIQCPKVQHAWLAPLAPCYLATFRLCYLHRAHQLLHYSCGQRRSSCSQWRVVSRNVAKKKHVVSSCTCAWTHSSLSHSMLCCSSWNWQCASSGRQVWQTERTRKMPWAWSYSN